MENKENKEKEKKGAPKESKTTKVFIVITAILIILLLTLLIVIILDKSKVINLASLDGNVLKELVTSENELAYGDVNKDGEISIKDATLVQEYVNGKEKLDDTQKKIADVDGDNEVTEIDAEIIQKKIAKLISAFPVEDSEVKVYTYGDVNEDSNIDISDATLIQEYVNGSKELTQLQKKAADVDGDGEVTKIDAEVIQKKIAGLIKEFPIENSKVEIYILGDVNEDGQINISDATLIQEYLNGLKELTQLQIKAADVNGDGKVSLEDVQSIQQKIANVIVNFQAETKDVKTNILGDVDGNGKLDIIDATLIQKFVAGSASLTSSQKAVADVDGDGNVTEIDAELIQKKIAKKIPAFPVEDPNVKGYVYGDVNEDSRIDIKDVTMVLKVVNGNTTLTKLQTKAADVDGDGNVTQIDAELIQRLIAKKISKFPAQDSSVKYYTLGDVNEDGTVDNADAVLLQKYISKTTNLSEIQKKAADYNSDGSIDINDSTEILKTAVKNSRSF